MNSSIESSQATRREFYVKSTATEEGDGSVDRPYQTLERAMTEIGAQKAERVDYVVQFLEDRYVLNKTITINSAFLSKGATLVFRGKAAKSTLTMARAVPNSKLKLWKAAEGNSDGRPIYHFTPENPVHGLIVGGVLRNMGAGKPASAIRIGRTNSFRVSGFTLNATSSAQIRSITAVGQSFWRHFRCPLVSLQNAAAGALVVQVDPICIEDPNGPAESEPYKFNSILQFENSSDFLRAHGDWMYDPVNKKVLVYLANPAEVSAVEGENPSFFRLQGTNGDRVGGISFNNLIFNGGGFIPRSTHFSSQAGLYTLPVKPQEFLNQAGALDFSNVESIRVENCEFRNLLGSGVSLTENANGVLITGNRFFDLAGSALAAYGTVMSQIKFNKNEIAEVGKTFWDSAAVFIGYAKNSEIGANTIRSVPWSGISVGWGWTHKSQTNVLGNNLIYENRIDGYCLIGNDCGGIYLNSSMPGTEVYRNTLGPIGSGQLPVRINLNHTIYLDGGSDMSIYDNVFNNIDYSLEFPWVTPADPIRGPQEVNPAAPCGRTACNITARNNTSPGAFAACTALVTSQGCGTYGSAPSIYGGGCATAAIPGWEVVYQETPSIRGAGPVHFWRQCSN